MLLSLSTVLMLVLLLTPMVRAEKPDQEAGGVTYRTIDVDFPGASATVITGRHARVLVGTYVDANGNNHGFIRSLQGEFHPLPLLTPQDRSAAGITGWYLAPGARPDGGAITTSFVLHEGTFTPFQVPRAGGIGTPFNFLTEALSINDAGVVVGDFRSGVDNVFRGFVYDPARDPAFATIEAPDSPLSTAVLWISPAGRMLVRAVYAGGVKRHFVLDGDTFTEVDIPDLPDVDLVARTDTGLTAGNRGTAGFVWDGSTLQEIAVPGAPLTELFGLQEQEGKVVVYGRYIGEDEVTHGFVATLGGKRLVARRSKHMQARFAEVDCCAGSKRQVCRGRE